MGTTLKCKGKKLWPNTWKMIDVDLEELECTKLLTEVLLL